MDDAVPAAPPQLQRPRGTRPSNSVSKSYRTLVTFKHLCNHSCLTARLGIKNLAPSPHWFRDAEEARQWREEYRRDYNQQRPHSALGNLTPEEFVRRVAGAAPLGGREGGESENGLPQVNQETMPTGLSLEVFQ